MADDFLFLPLPLSEDKGNRGSNRRYSNFFFFFLLAAAAAAKLLHPCPTV